MPKLLPQTQRVCRYYLTFPEGCARRSTCRFLHEDFPCKNHHSRGTRCSYGTKCLFSHAPLNDVQRTVLSKFSDMPEIELATLYKYYNEGFHHRRPYNNMKFSFDSKFKNKRLYEENYNSQKSMNDDDEFDISNHKKVKNTVYNKKVSNLDHKDKHYKRDIKSENKADDFDIEPVASSHDNRDCFSDTYRYSVSPKRLSKTKSTSREKVVQLSKREIRLRSPKNTESSMHNKNFTRKKSPLNSRVDKCDTSTKLKCSSDSNSKSTTKSCVNNNTLNNDKTNTNYPPPDIRNNFDSDNEPVDQNNVHKIKEDLTEEMEKYLEMPETHPAYKEEWNKFWSARYKELKDEGKHDPNTYDYSCEWIKFWDEHIRNIYNQKLNEYEKKLKEKTFTEDPNKTEPLLGKIKKKSITATFSTLKSSSAESDIQEIVCIENNEKSTSHSRNSKSRSRSRSPSCSKNTSKMHSIISILRQLSVLEPQLGSYSQHIITLLSCGLTLEKIKPLSSAELLTKENLLFLELVKEKLKGQLLAGIVQQSLTKPTLFCVKNIEELLLSMQDKPTVAPPIPKPPCNLLYGIDNPDTPPFPQEQKSLYPQNLSVNNSETIPSSQQQISVSTETSKSPRQQKLPTDSKTSKSSFFDKLSVISNSSSVTNKKPNKDLESISDEKLTYLLQNFKYLSRIKQEKLIIYLRKLEETEPNRVEKLKKFVHVS